MRTSARRLAQRPGAQANEDEGSRAVPWDCTTRVCAHRLTRAAMRLEAISPQLPSPVRELAGLSLHDGSLEAVIWEPATKRLRLSVVTWHPSGYQAVTGGGADSRRYTPEVSDWNST